MKYICNFVHVPFKMHSSSCFRNSVNFDLQIKSLLNKHLNIIQIEGNQTTNNLNIR